MKIYAFEWCGCVFESGYSTMRQHATKRAAFKDMVKTANESWYIERDAQIQCGDGFRPTISPLSFEAWRIVEIEVLDNGE